MEWVVAEAGAEAAAAAVAAVQVRAVAEEQGAGSAGKSGMRSRWGSSVRPTAAPSRRMKTTARGACGLRRRLPHPRRTCCDRRPQQPAVAEVGLWAVVGPWGR